MTEPRIPMTQEAFRDAGGGQCIRCKSYRIQGDRFKQESGLVSQPCTCLDCGARWEEMYRLAAYLREGGAGEEDWRYFETTELVAGSAPFPLVYVVTYEHKHGTDVSVYPTEEKAWAAIDEIKAEYPDDFDEDDPQSWADVTACRLNV